MKWNKSSADYCYMYRLLWKAFISIFQLGQWRFHVHVLETRTQHVALISSIENLLVFVIEILALVEWISPNNGVNFSATCAVHVSNLCINVSMLAFAIQVSWQAHIWLHHILHLDENPSYTKHTTLYTYLIPYVVFGSCAHFHYGTQHSLRRRTECYAMQTKYGCAATIE